MRALTLAIAAIAGLGATSFVSTANAAAPDCPNGGVVRMGVEPYETAAILTPIFDQVAKLIGKQLDCEVKVFVTTSYNAEIEAMRSGKLEFAEFGPLGYVLAHQVAGAEAVATYTDEHGKPSFYYASIVTWPGSGIKTIKDVAGKTFAYSDPASTSGHLFPAYGLSKAGIDPDHGVKALYAGSHTASFEAIRNHKVKAGELNSEEITATTAQGIYDPNAFVTLWKSDPIPVDPIAVRGSLPAGFKARLTKVLQNLDLSAMPEKDRKHLITVSTKLAPISDHAFDQIRDLVGTLHVDLAKL